MSESAGPPSELNSESSSDHEDGDNHWRNSQAAGKAPAGTGSESLIEDESPVAVQPEEDGFAFARDLYANITAGRISSGDDYDADVSTSIIS
jgi:hypothetical protein